VASEENEMHLVVEYGIHSVEIKITSVENEMYSVKNEMASFWSRTGITVGTKVPSESYRVPLEETKLTHWL